MGPGNGTRGGQKALRKMPRCAAGRVSGRAAATQHRGYREKKRVRSDVKHGRGERCYRTETPLPPPPPVSKR